MIATCDHCEKKYKIDPAKIKGPSARFKCKSCGNIVTVTKQQDEGVVVPPPATGAGRRKAPRKGYSRKKRTDTPVSAISSIRTKITLVIVLLVIISLGIVGYLASSQSREALSEQAEKHLRQMASQKAREYGQIFDRIKEELQGTAEYARVAIEREGTPGEVDIRMIIYGPEGPEDGAIPSARASSLKDEMYRYSNIGQVLQSQISKNPYLSLGYISSDNIRGNVLVLFDNKEVVDIILGIKEFHPHKRPWYIAAKKQKKTIWTPLYVDAASGNLTLTCATPVILSDQTFAGVVGFDVLLSTIEKDILSLKIGYNSYAFLINKDGKVLVRPGIKKGDMRWDSSVTAEDLLKVKNKDYNKIVRNMIRGRSGLETYSDETGEIYVAYAPIEAINATMGIVAKKNTVIEPAKNTQQYIIIASGVVFVIAILVGVLIGNGITKPINELTMMANLISQGKMDLNVLEENRKDEIGILTQSFNRLVISLKLAMSR